MIWNIFVIKFVIACVGEVCCLFKSEDENEVRFRVHFGPEPPLVYAQSVE